MRLRSLTDLATEDSSSNGCVCIRMCVCFEYTYACLFVYMSVRACMSVCVRARQRVCMCVLNI
jgi:hypothetical protein